MQMFMKFLNRRAKRLLLWLPMLAQVVHLASETSALAQLPPPDSQDAQPLQLEQLASETCALAQLPPPDLPDAQPLQLEQLSSETCALAQLPPPDSPDAQPLQLEQLLPSETCALAQLPPQVPPQLERLLSSETCVSVQPNQPTEPSFASFLLPPTGFGSFSFVFVFHPASWCAIEFFGSIGSKLFFRVVRSYTPDRIKCGIKGHRAVEGLVIQLPAHMPPWLWPSDPFEVEPAFQQGLAPAISGLTEEQFGLHGR